MALQAHELVPKRVNSVLDPFRRRSDEVPVSADEVALSSLLSFADPVDETDRALRRNQLQALIRLAPATIIVQLIAAGVTCLALSDHVPWHELALWFGASALLCITRGTRAYRLRTDPIYAQQHPAALRPITLVIMTLGLIWLMPALLWFPTVDARTQLLLCLLTMGLMSAGSVTLASVPQAALGYLALLGVGLLAMSHSFGGVQQVALGILYLMVLCWVVLANARQFVFNVRTRLEFQEHGQMISLLREFEASGTDWLWELDEQQRLVRVSRGLAEALGQSSNSLVGQSAFDVLDPNGRSSRLSAGMQILFEHAATGQAFRDVAIPMFEGQRWWTLSGKPLLGRSGKLIGWRGVGSDITEARLSGSDAVRAARRDPLTSIGNRLLVREQLEQSLLRQGSALAGCALLLVDLDRFKLVNDTLGHAIGDQLLCEVAERLEHSAGDSAFIGRLGGDEFAIVWTGDCSREFLAHMAKRLCGELERSVLIGGASLHVGATVGIAVSSPDVDTEDGLMRAADLALYSAKKAGRGRYAFFETAMLRQAEDNRLLENDVRDALASNSLSLVYQDIVDATTGRLLAREALLRWDHPERGTILPDQFVGLIEDIGLIHQIGAWVLRVALRDAAEWDPEVAVAVNVSGSQLAAPDFSNLVLNTLAVTGVKADRVQLEVTESIFLVDDQTSAAVLDQLHRLGVQLVLDDFGSGYCSFGYLRRARFGKLKIDQSFVRAAAAGDGDCRAIVEAVLALARTLGMRVTAEGIEREEEAAMMRLLGCDELQGYFFGKPTAVGPDETPWASSNERRSA